MRQGLKDLRDGIAGAVGGFAIGLAIALIVGTIAAPLIAPLKPYHQVISQGHSR